MSLQKNSPSREEQSGFSPERRYELNTIPGVETSRKHSRGWLRLIALLAVASTGYWFWNQYSTGPAASAKVTQPVVRGDIENSVTAVGKLEAVKSVDVGAQVSGQLKTLYVQIGDMVTQNQLIAEIDPAPTEHKLEIDDAELAMLEAQRIAKKAQLALKQTNIDRQHTLVAARSMAQSSLDQAVADLASAQADFDATEAQIRKQQATLGSDKVDLGYTKIYAPLSGTIVANPAKQGQTLNANQTTPTIVTIADLSTMVVKAQVSEADIGKLKLGMRAYFTLIGESGKRFPGTLRQIQPMPSTDNNVVLYYALFDVPNRDGELMMSMSAQVFFVKAAATGVLRIPAAALHPVEGKPGDVQVFVTNQNGSIEARHVDVGIRNRVNVEIKDGLREGEAVVVNDDGRKTRTGDTRLSSLF
ncbi:efflux RND transporter periplasmic adaptor subunit [Agrobacterium rhizogenes]|nr:efflux RND transporter periplasmic adaptor subunit [Rhizobium rhizogenes]NTJ80895.1 efflux RND transporter periplasmic adaptor subunit [Rhizobium rhizogenes]